MADFDHWVSGIELWHWRQQAQAQATAADIAATEVDWLLQEFAPLDRLSLRLETFKTKPNIPLKYSLSELTHLWHQRLQHKVPIQYLAGSTPWRQFSLRVSPAVLIPRPETELLIDWVTCAAQQDVALQQGDWADLGTGSGAIAIGLADALPQATLHAVDQNKAALEIAQQNAVQLGFEHRIRFYQGSWFEPLIHLKGELRGMVSNPPYIPTDLIATLQPEVADHEPHAALDGGIDGLDCIRHLVSSAPDYLISGGIWLIEMMAGQAEAVSDLLAAQGSYREIQIHPDLAGIDRFAVAYRK
jgi:release factor glutamine methyltransferase